MSKSLLEKARELGHIPTYMDLEYANQARSIVPELLKYIKSLEDTVSQERMINASWIPGFDADGRQR